MTAQPPALASLRLAAGMTQTEMSARAGLHRVQLAKYEAGDQAPSVYAAMAMAKVLGVPVETAFATEQSRRARDARRELKHGRNAQRPARGRAQRVRGDQSTDRQGA